jgi:branched-chain amino acid transport system ATP-binding protein
MSAPDPVLDVQDLRVAYGAAQAVRGIDLQVPRGAVVALIGPNGAGKTSALRAIGGQLRSRGRVVFAGRDVSRWQAHTIAAAGFAQVPQGRRLFAELTAEENLLLGAWGRPAKERDRALADAYAMFPRIEERARQRAGSLSGGEQQMVAIARALMREPTLIAMDEPSLGLAPIVVRDMFDTIRRIGESGVSVLLVEQNAVQALAVSDSVYVLNRGHVVYSGASERAAEELDVVSAYLR